MKKISALLLGLFIISPALSFADDTSPAVSMDQPEMQNVATQPIEEVATPVSEVKKETKKKSHHKKHHKKNKHRRKKHHSS